MSAFVVNPAHINALVTWAAMKRDLSYYWQNRTRHIKGDEKRIAAVLHAENVRSVNSRYQDHEPAHGFRYKFTLNDATRSPVSIIKACHGYEYQACETDDWRESEAHAIIRAIERHAMHSLPGYESADWEIREVTA